ncbi:MPN552 family protein [[Mycoplasma] testudinis]|uniref:MPN552 family protein n=1 Tax=[Mycoplasma] testudinis TaxID=33924 RepID=UPI000483E6BA|nr:hypothetical protein [[Mycoplasma] testudinis]
MGKKLFIFDTNLSSIYDEHVNLEKFSEFLKTLSKDNFVLLTTNGWYEQAAQICEVLNTAKIDIISGSGAVLKRSELPAFQYFGFINRNDVDLILHLAIASYSGVIVKGRSKGDNQSNVFLNYFLNFQDVKDFKGIWKFGSLEQNNDYLSFETALNQIDISEVYVFENNRNFAVKFLAQDNEINDLLKERNLNINEFLTKNYAFTRKGVSKATAINAYLKASYLNLEDVVYISLGELDYVGLHRYGEVILPEYTSEEFKKNSTFIYNPKNPLEILDYLNTTKKINEFQ